jgi:hypothetical protein
VGSFVLPWRDQMEFESNWCHVFVCNVMFMTSVPCHIFCLTGWKDDVFMTIFCKWKFLVMYFMFKPGSDACLDQKPSLHPPTRRTLTLFVNWAVPHAIYLPFHPEPGFTEEVKPTILYIIWKLKNNPLLALSKNNYHWHIRFSVK